MTLALGCGDRSLSARRRVGPLRLVADSSALDDEPQGGRGRPGGVVEARRSRSRTDRERDSCEGQWLSTGGARRVTRGEGHVGLLESERLVSSLLSIRIPYRSAVRSGAVSVSATPDAGGPTPVYPTLRPAEGRRPSQQSTVSAARVRSGSSGGAALVPPSAGPRFRGGQARDADQPDVFATAGRLRGRGCRASASGPQVQPIAAGEGSGVPGTRWHERGGHERALASRRTPVPCELLGLEFFRNGRSGANREARRGPLSAPRLRDRFEDDGAGPRPGTDLAGLLAYLGDTS